MKLLPELSSNWGVTIKPVYGAGVWDKYRKKSYAKAGHKCEICGESGLNQGFKHPVECHEIWSWDIENSVQTLEGLISLCPLCHKAKHFGRNGMEQSIDRMVYVNGITKEEALDIIKAEDLSHSIRNKIKWNVDFTKVGLTFIKYEDTVEVIEKQQEKRRSSGKTNPQVSEHFKNVMREIKEINDKEAAKKAAKKLKNK
jgi:hypothetical protein